MGRKARLGKSKWHSHITRGRNNAEKQRGDIEELRTFIQRMRAINEGNSEAGRFLDEFSAVVDRIAARNTGMEVEFIGLLAIGTQEEPNDE